MPRKQLRTERRDNDQSTGREGGRRDREAKAGEVRTDGGGRAAEAGLPDWAEPSWRGWGLRWCSAFRDAISRQAAGSQSDQNGGTGGCEYGWRSEQRGTAGAVLGESAQEQTSSSEDYSQQPAPSCAGPGCRQQSYDNGAADNGQLAISRRLTTTPTI